MKLPLFYNAAIDSSTTSVELDEATSKHIIQVLRMQVGEQLQLTNGKGMLLTAAITNDNRKKVVVAIHHTEKSKAYPSKISIAISPVKNNTRFEWFLEKATEIGVAEIIPLICARTEKQQFKWERMNAILVSAMLQSQQVWLPVLREPIKFSKYLSDLNRVPSLLKMIAHCEDENYKQSLQKIADPASDQLILIGPEGDFTPQEIDYALQNGCVPVSLGNTRLRTETAGIVAAALLCIKND